ncbi:MAG: MFS transporter, partial [Nocardioidaceae bacterium]|nr:MFS transporter [Nocardioidaceae bacterium]
PRLFEEDFTLMVIGYVITEFDSVRGTAGLVVSFTLLASAVGGVLFGFLADRIGRTRSMMLSILCYSIGTMLCGLSTDMGTLLAARIVVGLGVGGEWGAGAALVTETWPAKHRGRVMAWVQSAFAAGYAVAAIVAAVFVPTLGWRWAFFFGVLPALFAFWVRRNTEESEVWMRQDRRNTFVESVKTLFTRHPREFAVCFLFTASASCGYWGLFTWLPNYLATPVEDGGRGMGMLGSTLWIVVMQLGAFVGFISFGYVADWWGRRAAFIGYFLAAAVCVPVFVSLTTPWLVIALGVVMSLFGSGFYSGFGPTFAETFPTEIRAFAQGLVYNGGRATSALAPAMVGFLAANLGVGLAMATTAGFYVLAAVIVFGFLRETKGVDLEAVV